MLGIQVPLRSSKRAHSIFSVRIYTIHGQRDTRGDMLHTGSSLTRIRNGKAAGVRSVLGVGARTSLPGWCLASNLQHPHTPSIFSRLLISLQVTIAAVSPRVGCGSEGHRWRGNNNYHNNAAINPQRQTCCCYCCLLHSIRIISHPHIHTALPPTTSSTTYDVIPQGFLRGTSKEK